MHHDQKIKNGKLARGDMVVVKIKVSLACSMNSFLADGLVKVTQVLLSKVVVLEGKRGQCSRPTIGG